MLKCNCGSGEYKYSLSDGYGIFLCYACSECEEEKLQGFRPDIMECYQADESIEEDE